MLGPDFSGKICLVTGGTQGVGEATVRLMAEAGAGALAFCGRRTAPGRALEAEL